MQETDSLGAAPGGECVASRAESAMPRVKERVKTCSRAATKSRPGVHKCIEAVSKILAEQDEDTAEVDEAQIVGGMIFRADHQPPEVA